MQIHTTFLLNLTEGDDHSVPKTLQTVSLYYDVCAVASQAMCRLAFTVIM